MVEMDKIIFTLTWFPPDSRQFSQVVVLNVKISSELLEFDLLNNVLTNGMCWETLIAKANAFFPAPAHVVDSGPFQLIYVDDTNRQNVLVKNNEELACIIKMNAVKCLQNLPFPLYVSSFA